jgi:hypothetical protein
MIGVLAALSTPALLQGQVFVNGGVTSVNLDFAALQSAASLEILSVNDAVPAAPGFAAGFTITTDSPFTFDATEFAPLGGSISHTGSLTFQIVNTTDTVTVGNLDIGFDAGRAGGNNSGFFVSDTISGLGILFDVGAPDLDSFIASNQAFFAWADLFVSPEFAGFLQTAGLAQTNLAGAAIGSAQIDAAVIPEPSTVALLAGLGVLGLVLYRRRKQAT